MCKKILLSSFFTFLLAGCDNLPSPQETQPTQQSECAAIRAHMGPTIGSDNNTPAAISDSQNIDYQKLYQQKCE